MSNVFSYGKCWNFGRMVRVEFEGKWSDLIKRDDWKEFKEKYKLTDNQMFYIKRGFMGIPFADEKQETTLDDEIFPFGKFKGKKFRDLPDKYIRWANEQDWLEKWPTVALYIHRRMEEIRENTPTKEEIKELLKMN